MTKTGSESEEQVAKYSLIDDEGTPDPNTVLCRRHMTPGIMRSQARAAGEGTIMNSWSSIPAGADIACVRCARRAKSEG